MPCQSYDTNWAHDSNSDEVKRLKKETDKLARIACKALTALEELEQEDFLILKDDEVREWWSAHKEADRKEQERIAEKERKERMREEALAKLSSEERELLGLAPKAKVKSKNARVGTIVPIEDIEYDLGELLKQVNGGWKSRK
jgi:hypothetical protein